MQNKNTAINYCCSQWRTQDFSVGGGSKVTSKICSRSMLWRINNLVQCNKMESKSHSA